MNRHVKSIYSALVAFGFDPRRTLRSLKGLPQYVRDRRRFRKAEGRETDFPFGMDYPCLGEHTAESGATRGHYFHQDLLVARRILGRQTRVHVDVGSRIDGFVAHVAASRPITVIDIRAAPTRIPNVTFLQADIMGSLPETLVGTCDSLSCLHALEHFGLGRYGDPIRPDGHLLGLNNLCRMLEPHGMFYLSVPIGPQRVEFNAHRVFCLDYLLRVLRGRFTVDGFSFIDDRGDLHEDVEISEANVARNCGCFFGCGVFELTKTSSV